MGLNLRLNHRGQGSTKVAKIMVVQVCFPMHLYGKKHLKILFSKTQDALWLNLCIYYWEHLHVRSGYVTQVSEPWPVGLLFYFTTTNELWGNRAMWFHVHMSQLPLWTQILSEKSFAFFKSFYPH